METASRVHQCSELQVIDFHFGLPFPLSIQQVCFSYMPWSLAHLDCIFRTHRFSTILLPTQSANGQPLFWITHWLIISLVRLILNVGYLVNTVLWGGRLPKCHSLLSRKLAPQVLFFAFREAWLQGWFFNLAATKTFARAAVSRAVSGSCSLMFSYVLIHTCNLGQHS